MRHVLGFFLALAAAAALFFGGGWGIARFHHVFAAHGLRDATAWTNMHNVLPLAALLATGLFIGILALGAPGLGPRYRPARPRADRLVGAGDPARQDRAATTSRWPTAATAGALAAMLSSGALMLIGAALIIPLFMPSRWRSDQAEVEDYDDEFATTASLVP